MSAWRIEACPKCGGGTGYVYTVRLEMEGEWGREGEATGSGEGGSKTVKCLDCGAKVRRSRAEGWSEDR